MKSTGFSRDHPLIRRIEQIVRSEEGRKAAKQAADSGRPALEGVDPMLREALGENYGSPEARKWAGWFVSDEMRKAGYKQNGARPLKGGVAKSGAFFTKG